MWIRTVDYLLAGVGLCGHVFLLILLLRRGLFARLPFFSILVAFYVVRTIASVFLSPASADLGWALAATDPLLQCAVFVSIILVWGVSGACRSGSSVLGMLAGTLAIAALASWYMGPSSHFSVRNLLFKAGIFVSVLWLEAALLTLVPLRRLRLAPPDSPHNQIILGFAMYSAANLVADLGRYHLQAIGGMALYLALSYIPVGAYLVCLGIWIRACLRANPASANPADLVPATGA